MEIIAIINIFLFMVLLIFCLAALLYFKTIPLDKLKQAAQKDDVLFTTSNMNNYKVGEIYSKHLITRIEKGFYYFIIYGKPL